MHLSHKGLPAHTAQLPPLQQPRFLHTRCACLPRPLGLAAHSQARPSTRTHAAQHSGPTSEDQQQQQQPQQPQQLPSTSAASPSSSSSSSSQGSPSQGDDPQNQRNGPASWLRQRLQGSMNWAAGFSQGRGLRDPNLLRLIRLLIISITFMVVAASREVFVTRNKLTTKEVLYSHFVTLLDQRRVRAARLESGTGRMYFELHPREEQTSTATPAATPTETAAPSQALPPSTRGGKASSKAANSDSAQAAASSSSSSAAASTSAAATGVSEAASVQGGAPSASSSSSSAPGRFKKQYVVKLADRNDYLLASKVLASGVEFGVLKQSFTQAVANVFLTALSLWIPLTPLFFLMRRILDDRSGTKKKRSDSKAQAVSTTFNDVAGVDSAKEELLEVVEVMKQARTSYARLKVKMPSGVLLCGPPGTGKTLLARAVAGEAGIPFLAVSASEFVELFVGRGAARIRELFAEARKATPCVIFIDELDAVGAKRGLGYNDERDQTLNQLLTELDGFEGRQGVLFLAATNRIDVLDPALLRPGRINRKVVVPLPDEGGRRDILNVHMRGVPMTSEAEKADACARLARVTAGFSGAELANVINESALLAARKDQDYVTLRECLEGVRRTKFGVNGQTTNPVVLRFQNWLMDMAVNRPEERKVGNIAA